MNGRAVDSQEWFDLAACVRREARRRELRAALTHPVRALVSRVVRIVGLLAIVTVVFKASFVEAFFVPSVSMKPTLRESDYILVPKFMYGLHVPWVQDLIVQWAHPRRGDVIVFNRGEGVHSSEEHQTMVKRVIGVEGDTVEIVGSTVMLNGTPLVEPYTLSTGSSLSLEHFGPFTVPAGKLFVLGDNRDNSDDSRFWQDPFVSLSQVVGKAVMVYWSGSQDNRVGTVL
jgi:signal peptidase I